MRGSPSLRTPVLEAWFRKRHLLHFSIQSKKMIQYFKSLQKHSRNIAQRSNQTIFCFPCLLESWYQSACVSNLFYGFQFLKFVNSRRCFSLVKDWSILSTPLQGNVLYFHITVASGVYIFIVLLVIIGRQELLGWLFVM